MVRFINPEDYRNIHIGVLPPPHGGVSTYLHRLSKIGKSIEILNKNEYNNSVIRVLLQIIRYAFGKKINFILHAPSLKYIFILTIVSYVFRTKNSIVVHGEALENRYEIIPSLFQWIIRVFLRRAFYIQVVGEHLVPFINKYSNKEVGKHFFIQNAFLPPPIEEKDEIMNSYPQEFKDFVLARTPLLIANAFSISFFNGVDLYGLDMCINAVKVLKEDYPDIGFVFAVANLDINKDYVRKCKNKINEYGIYNNFVIISLNEPIWPLFQIADLMVRPTNTDGDAVSIRESLSMNCPVIASDVTPRPDGAVLFQSRNCNLFLKAVKTLLNERIDI